MVRMVRTAVKATKANDPCFCGSGQKFKRCHKRSYEPIRPHPITAMRTVPEGIERPPYAETGEAPRIKASHVRPPEMIEAMRRTGQLAAEILAALGEMAEPGTTTEEIDAACHQMTVDAGAYPSTLNYHGYRKSVCTSINEVICHGIPDGRALVDGDIVNIDVTAFREGVHGDTSATFLIGTVDEESQRLVRVTKECLDRSVAIVAPGVPFSEIGRQIEAHATAEGFGVVQEFVAHGICDQFHTDLQIPHYYEPRMTQKMEAGMTFTIEPMIKVGDAPARIWDDDWTAVTADGGRTAQFEYTLLVTEDGVEHLTPQLYPELP